MADQPGTVHLIGGGRDETAIVRLLTAFVAECAGVGDAAHAAPLVAVLLVLEPDDDESAERFRRALTLAGADASVRAIIGGEAFDGAALDGADGVFVGGGLTPAYLDACAVIASLLRAKVSGGMPYAGFSAGAAIAADRAVIGGYLVEGVAVCDPDAGEELDDVTVVDGLGLVPFSVDVHAAQWGTVSRMVAAASSGLVSSGFAVDEHTVVRWQGGASASDARIAGSGAAWQVGRAAQPSASSGTVDVTRRIADR